MKLPRELAPIRDWLDDQRPWKDQSLEELLEADANVFVNATRALAIADFQGGVWMLAKAIREGRAKAKRRPRERPIAPVQREFTADEFPQAL